MPPSSLRPLLGRTTLRTSLAGLQHIAVRRRCSAADDVQRARDFLRELGYSSEVSDGVLKALESPDWGLQPGQTHALVVKLAGPWEIGGDAGLKGLAKAVEREQLERAGTHMVSFRVHPSSGAPFKCSGFAGKTLRDIAEAGEDEGAQLLSEYLECACSGVMACSTCHVYVHSSWFAAVGPPSEEEQDMLDLAFEPRRTSRLGCQIVLRPELEGLVVAVPSQANNLFDHIPFE
ncbi:hypothetical protein AB1Y20_019701 [Prymnesium parvum]|uniref:2Fe-2S ferredoxin-type domain-containing protein n=1 Tax=Prymnesium parvum TaxID=97485 RepID=A0AB34JVP6_PRYPA